MTASAKHPSQIKASHVLSDRSLPGTIVFQFLLDALDQGILKPFSAVGCFVHTKMRPCSSVKKVSFNRQSERIAFYVDLTYKLQSDRSHVGFPIFPELQIVFVRFQFGFDYSQIKALNCAHDSICT